MPFETIQTDTVQGVMTITLNRPERLNAFTPVMMREMCVAFDEADADDAMRAAIVTGAGRAFCAGADLVAGRKWRGQRGCRVVSRKPGRGSSDGVSTDLPSSAPRMDDEPW